MSAQDKPPTLAGVTSGNEFQKWWVDTTRAETLKVKTPKPEGTRLAGMKFYKVAEGFEQEAARERLTDNNLKLLLGHALQFGRWKVVALVPGRRASRRDVQRVLDAVILPPYACGLVVDCGQVLRLLVTGSPIGERILELALGDLPSFDAWIQDEWVEEKLFPGRARALREFRTAIRRYLSPEAIALYKAVMPRV